MSTSTPVPAPPRGAYVLTPQELDDVLRETTRMAAEYWGIRAPIGTEKLAADVAAEMLARLEAEREGRFDE
jgi:hypothetical protein